MQKPQVYETVTIRFPKALWTRVRMRALERGESGLAWLSRCAEAALGGAVAAEKKSDVGPALVVTSEAVTQPVSVGVDVGEGRDRSVVSETREEFERDRHGETGQRLAEGPSREKNPIVPTACAGCGHAMAAHMRTVKGQNLVGRCAFGTGCPCRKYQAPADPPKLPKPLDEGVF